MTLLPDWPVTLSSLGEASISYPQQVIRQLSSLTLGSSSLLGATGKGKDHLSSFIDNFLVNPTSPLSIAALTLTAIVGILTIVTMSWRDTFGFFRRTPSYGYNVPAVPPQVSDSDYSYLTSDDIVQPPRPYQQSHNEGRRVLRREINHVEDESPDILLLKHRGVTYPLHFPPYAIDDGDLTVGQLRRLAAEKTGTSDVNRIKILYKGKLLRDDAKPCKDEGLRQNSEVMCVVSEVRPGESTSSFSGSEAGSRSEALSLDSRSNQNPPSGGGSGKKKGNKKKKKKPQHLAPEPTFAETRKTPSKDSLAPPSDVRPTSAGRSSATPSPAPNLQQFSTPTEQVDALLRYLRTELAPLCEKHLSHPPTDPKARSYEHKLLNETILSQVILKADSIDSEEARPARRALIKEAQGLLNKLDAHCPQDS
ncbi:hypothetical protein EYB25_001467 [Talaromyces marneffei]|uniref:BAG family molecular chaperone regulator 1A n=1 Tax=Talaromyces marneffei PM1 TaxID=1077442 RepID=A0A093XZS6_TALMA|nr:uncharacterized protein EYB26_000869 [Talaromyces marneffei]KAE8556763.1 hypothetical protein EYB25_001467 [Talaromyces marneffei]QGA13222.1 hypothetical protein EYB26_000869 [Talaromyces marneffei]